MTKVKICGITNLEDALAATHYGADLLGFIFYEPSPRYVPPETVKTIISHLRTGQKTPPQFVGVFVNESFNKINHIFEDCQLDRIQLHGEEPPDWITRFAGRAFKAIRPQSAVETTALLDQYLPVASTTPPYFLLDAYHPNLYGGTGHVTDWTTAADLARHLALMLAGSLTPANVAEAITAVQPWAVDVSSGLEAEKGRKDHDKIRAFMAAVRETTGE